MRNVRVKLSYDGSCFHGWQRQAGFMTVQEALEDACLELTSERVTVHGSGRTDAGVHAFGQVANFHIATRLDDDRLRHALNAHLPRGVVVRRLETCPGDFHARFSAKGKRYLYVTHTARFRSPFGRSYSNWVSSALDLKAMRDAAARLRGEHDFVAFSSTGSERSTTVRTIGSMHVYARRERVAFAVQGNGFLYNMVRIIAGTLLEVGRGHRDPDCISQALSTGDRSLLGVTAPAEGLYLVSVLYPERVFAGDDFGPRGTPGVF
jgi:tRNA pseudouridine38-40 synthase